MMRTALMRALVLMAAALWMAAPDSCLAQTIKIGIVRNPGGYAEAMRDGFMLHLQQAGLAQVDYLDKLGYADQGDADKNVALAQEAVQWGADLIVTIGSSTSHAVGGHFKGQKVPILYMGITDPVAGGLIKEPGQPTGDNVTGVSFPIPVPRTLAVLGRVFPKAKTYCFVYNSRLPPDAAYVRWVRAYAETHKTPAIKFIDTTEERGLTAEELKGADLFFGWYSAHLYKYASRYPQVVFTGNTLEECRGGAVVSIYPKLPELGAQAARIASKILKEKVSPGSIAPEDPREYGICFNIGKIQALGLKIPQGMLELADEKVE